MSNWIIHAALCNDKGLKRKNNEDAFYLNGFSLKLSEMDQGAYEKKDITAAGSLWAVCDGMGGQNNGEIASYTAVSDMEDLQSYLNGRDFATAIQKWISKKNAEVNNQTDNGGTTLVMLYCTNEYIQTAHVGDSRIYRFHDGELIQITKDHSKVEMLLSAGIITKEEARTHPQKNVITRYLGMDDEFICEAALSSKIPLVHGDRYLLCSDGVTDMLTDDEIAEELRETENSSTCVDNLKQAVIQHGARDNYTIMVLDLEEEGGSEKIPEAADDGLSMINIQEIKPAKRIEDDTVVDVDLNLHGALSADYEIILDWLPVKVLLHVRAASA